MHAVFSVESSPTVRKMRPFTRFWRKLCVISSLLEIFRRLNAISVAFYTPNAIHSVFSVETSPTVRKMRPYSRCCRKLCVISVLLEIFRRLIAISVAFYTPNAIHALFSVETIRPVWKMWPHTRFWRQTERYFVIVGDISSFKRYFHRILHVECYARQIHRRNKPDCSQNATRYSILTKNCAIYRSCWRYFDV